MKKPKVCLFEKKLSMQGSEALKSRAALIREAAADMYQDELKKKQGELRSLKMALSMLEDMSPEHTTSLKPNAKGVIEGTWVQEHIELSLKIALLEPQIEIIEDQYKRLFVIDTEEKTEETE